MSEFCHPECVQEVRWGDQAFESQWPAVSKRLISPKDKDYAFVQKGKTI